jgi:hypothetical protein
MPTQRKLGRHRTLPAPQKNQQRTCCSTKPKLRHPLTTHKLIHRRHQSLPPITRRRMVCQTLRQTRHAHRHQIKPTKNTTARRPTRTHVHKTTRNTNTPNHNPATRKHTNGRMQTPWTSHWHQHICDELHETTSHQMPHCSKQNNHKTSRQTNHQFHLSMLCTTRSRTPHRHRHTQCMRQKRQSATRRPH